MSKEPWGTPSERDDHRFKLRPDLFPAPELLPDRPAERLRSISDDMLAEARAELAKDPPALEIDHDHSRDDDRW